MNLVLDLGNTLSKMAVFNGPDLVTYSAHQVLTVADLEQVMLKFPLIRHAILSSVIKQDPKLAERLRSRVGLIVLDHQTPLPFINSYRTPDTLGKDRLAAAAGGHLLFPGKPVLIIDAGTCIKFDFVSEKGDYQGGAISPGIDMRFKALHQFTDQLPLIASNSKPLLIGNDTEGSILSGVLNGVAEEVKGIAARYMQQYPGLRIVLTGGHMKKLEEIFNASDTKNSSIFADPYLVLKGLNSILEFNSKR